MKDEFDSAIEHRYDAQRKSLRRLAEELRGYADRVDRIVFAASTPEELVQLSTSLLDDNLLPAIERIRDVELQDDTLYQLLLIGGRL